MTAWAACCVLCATRMAARMRRDLHRDPTPAEVLARIPRLPHGHVCPGCLARIGDDLVAIVDLAAAASVEPGSGAPTTGRSAPGSRPPIRLDAIDPALTLVPVPGLAPDDWPTVLGILEDWCRLVREARALPPYGVASASWADTGPMAPQDVLTRVSAFLRASLPWWADSPDQPIDDLATEVHACRRALARFDPDRQPLGYVAYCPTDHCGARLSYHHADEQVTCPRCHVTRDVPQLVAVVLAGDHDDIWADPDTAALHYGVSVSRLRAWAIEGRVVRKGGRYRIAGSDGHARLAKSIVETSVSQSGT